MVQGDFNNTVDWVAKTSKTASGGERGSISAIYNGVITNPAGTNGYGVLNNGSTATLTFSDFPAAASSIQIVYTIEDAGSVVIRGSGGSSSITTATGLGNIVTTSNLVAQLGTN